MDLLKQKSQIKEFISYWEDRGSEKAESQKFWLQLLGVLGVDNPTSYIMFEEPILMKNTGFMDGFIEKTKVLIEQKSRNKNLKAGIVQSDGTKLSPFEQARRYVIDLPVSKHPRYIVTCNFQEFHIYDMEKPHGDPEIIELKNLEKEIYRLEFLVDKENTHIQKETEVSIKAGELVGKLYELLIQQYNDPTDPKSLESLNMLCVRIVFCLYAEDAGVFGRHNMFHDYIDTFQVKDTRRAIINLFKVLNQKPHDRDPYEDEKLLEFPYVNGGLFEGVDLEIPQFTQEIVALIKKEASEDFDWSAISPTIFGAVFESTLNPETRHKGGMHYTSIENIHKVIDNLFLNELNRELESILQIKVYKTKRDKLLDFQEKLSQIKFLDPACGSGNFLTETYISLRKIENKVITELTNGQQSLNIDGVIKVSIAQFYGIEINDFATTVAKTALWIAESQMMKETEEIVYMNLNFLPLKSYANIVCDNALKLEWKDVVSKDDLNYIMGNPPFLGFTYMQEAQKADMQKLFPKDKNLDLVCGWYKKTNDLIKGTKIECGYVSTNSITQGETVATLWKHLDFKINFAYKTFNWTSEASQKAAVHCVIIGFADFNRAEKLLYTNNEVFKKVFNINPYLYEGEHIVVNSRQAPLFNAIPMIYGNKPADGGNLILEDEIYDDFIQKEPLASKYIRPLLGAREFINNKKRWCLWLVGAAPNELAKMPMVQKRIEQCRDSRNNSPAAGIRKFALTPSLFAQITQPADVDYLLIPRVSSEKRSYIPIGFMDSKSIVTDAVQIIPGASYYEFGVLTSNVHMAWMKTTCGRLKSDYRYSKDIVYNNFPWCNATDIQKEKIFTTAKAILDARNKFPESSLADLYNIDTMPPELTKAHQENNKAVMEAYGFSVKISSAECVEELMRLYKEKVAESSSK